MVETNPFDVPDEGEINYHHVPSSELEEFSLLQYQSLASDFESRLWFSYRKDFPPITNELKQIEPMTVAPSNNISGGLCYYTTNRKNKTPDESSERTYSLSRIYQSMVSYTSDAGWGCMMRSGQMMLAQAFVHYYLGRGFRLPVEEKQSNVYQMIISWFLDHEEAPYSIHRIAQAGTLFNKKIGEWFGPSTIATVLQRLVYEHLKTDFLIYMADQGGIYTDEIEAICTGAKDPIQIDHDEELKDTVIVNKSDIEEHNDRPKTKPIDPTVWKPVVILMPLRLGLDVLNPIYLDSIKKVFEIPQTLGIMGGKPKSSLYFVGYQEDDVFYLDPHTVQKTIGKGSQAITNYKSFHCSVPRKMRILDMDPSMALGFLCQGRADFEEFCQHARMFAQLENPLMSVQKERPTMSSEVSVDCFDADEDLVVL
jgi:cysteine protease ATG4